MKRTIKRILNYLWLFMVLATGSVYAGDKIIDTIFLDAQLLAENKLRIQNGTASIEAQKSYSRLLEEAEKAIDVGMLSVTDKTMSPPSGNLKDYYSLSPYWWPNPDTENGLPWIRHDGKTNPDAKTNATDNVRIYKFISTIRVLALAYYFTDDHKYAEQAVKMVRHWFLDPKTGMNPNLRYAQVVNGVDDERRTGMIDARFFSDRLLDTLILIKASSYWTDEDNKSMNIWLNQYVDWLITSYQGTAEVFAENNHGSWEQVQIAGIAYYLGRLDLAKLMVGMAKHRIATQFKEDGSQPEELARTRAYHYSYFNLDALVYLAQLGDKLGIDLWNYEYKNRSLKKAIDYMSMFPTAESWAKQHEDHDVKKGQYANYRMLTLYRKMESALNQPIYSDVIKQIGFKNPEMSDKTMIHIWAERDAYLLYSRN